MCPFLSVSLFLVLFGGVRADGPADNQPTRSAASHRCPRTRPGRREGRPAARGGRTGQGNRIAPHGAQGQAGNCSNCCPTCRSSTTPSGTPRLRRDLRRQARGAVRPQATRSRAWSGPRQLARRAGPVDDRRPAWSSAATCRRSTARCSPTAWSCPTSYRPTAPHQLPARRLVPRPRRDAERGQLPRRPAERRPASSRRRTRSSCTPTAATATPTSSPARSTASRRSSTSRSTTRSTTTGSSMRGFSMGGAACWQFAVHYPDRWFAAAPGAGFAETPEFLKVFQNEKVAADLVREEALAPVRLHRLRRQPVQPARRSPTAARSTGRSRPPT